MRKWYFGLLSFVLATATWAEASLEPLLNKVSLQLSAEQWVSTKTALVIIGINASVSDTDLAKIQSSVLSQLGQLAKADWHITSFDRSLDQSGLEKIQASSQARLPESSLAGLRDKVKAMSKPGLTYTLDGVQFIPSEEETRLANADLRNNIYQQVKTEIDQLNKLSSDQKYYIHAINFISELSPVPMPQNVSYAAAKSMPRVSEPLAVGDKLKLSATVILAAAPNVEVIKMLHN